MHANFSCSFEIENLKTCKGSFRFLAVSLHRLKAQSGTGHRRWELPKCKCQREMGA